MGREFEQLYNTYYMQVYSYVMVLAKNRHSAEEITQKTFFKAMTASKKHNGASSEFTWLCAIAKNLFADELRVHKRIAEMTDEVISDTDIESSFVDEDSTFRIHAILHSLDEPYKEVFQLRVFGELPFQKIGLLFGKTENWARVTYVWPAITAAPHHTGKEPERQYAKAAAKSIASALGAGRKRDSFMRGTKTSFPGAWGIFWNPPRPTRQNSLTCCTR